MAEDKRNLIPPWMQRWLMNAFKGIIYLVITGLCTFLYNLDKDINALQAKHEALVGKKETDNKQWERIGKLMEDVSRLNTFHEGH